MKKTINKNLEEMLDEVPKTTGAKAKLNILEVYHECLAQVYVVDGWATYMENLINMLVRDAVINFDNIEQLRYKQGKIALAKELLVRSKKSFEMGNKINKIHSLGKQAGEVKL